MNRTYCLVDGGMGDYTRQEEEEGENEKEKRREKRGERERNRKRNGRGFVGCEGVVMMMTELWAKEGRVFMNKLGPYAKSKGDIKKV